MLLLRRAARPGPLVLLSSARRALAADASKPAAAAGAGGAAAAPAAKPAAAGGGGGGGKKAKKVDPHAHVREATPAYAHGASGVVSRSAARAAARAATLAALKADAASALAPALSRLTGDVVRDDPVLSALLREEAGAGGLPPGARALTPSGAERLAGAEEPADLAAHAATDRARVLIADRLRELPEEAQARLLVTRAPEDGAFETDVEGEDEAEAEYKRVFASAVRSFRPALPAARGDDADAEDGGSAAAAAAAAARGADDARVRAMARALLTGVDVEKLMAETAAALGDPAGAGAPAAVAADAMRVVRDAAGRVRPPEEAAGLEPGREHLVDAALARLRGTPAPPRGAVAAALAATRAVDDDPKSDTFGTRASGPWGDDVRRVPEGLLGDVANPFDFSPVEEAADADAPPETLREELMTPAERAVNATRKRLRALLEAPKALRYRPAWPVYSLIAGMDRVTQVIKSGNVQSTRVMVVVGNGMGALGVGMVAHRSVEAATSKALARAIAGLVFVGHRDGALYHDLIGKKNGVYVILRATPRSSHVSKAAPLVANILRLAGITHYSAKIVGSHRGRRNPYVVTQALFDAFHHHYPPERDAYLRGLRPVWATTDRVSRHNAYPQPRAGPRFPPANSRIQAAVGANRA